MRGRSPRPLTIQPADTPILQGVAHSRRLAWFQVQHVLTSWPEYNQRYAGPFNWTWTNDQMRRWFAEHAP
jgi:hypothetical protein